MVTGTRKTSCLKNIIKQACQVVLGSLLQCLDSEHLEVQVICPIFLHDLIHQACKRPLADEELGAPLILTFLMESYHPQLVPPGYYQPTLLKFIVGTFPPMVGLMQPTSSLKVEGFTSATSLTKSHVDEDPGYLPAISRLFNSHSLLTSSSGEGGVLSESTPAMDPSFCLPIALLLSLPFELEQQPEFVAGLLKLHAFPSISY